MRPHRRISPSCLSPTRGTRGDGCDVMRAADLVCPRASRPVNDQLALGAMRYIYRHREEWFRATYGSSASMTSTARFHPRLHCTTIHQPFLTAWDALLRCGSFARSWAAVPPTGHRPRPELVIGQFTPVEKGALMLYGPMTLPAVPARARYRRPTAQKVPAG